ncbi:MAG: HD domain-containing protein [Methylococcales bacterium]|nr:HD domain-containing protein [Methylococcales bacterium]
MIDDFLDVTDANVLLIGSEQLGGIFDLLKANNYQNVQCADFVKKAIELYQTSLPDLIVFSSLAPLELSELTNKLSEVIPSINFPPVFFISYQENHIPSVGTVVKDFINSPINENEFLFRVHQLLTSYLSSQELHKYNQTILKTVETRNQELMESQTEIIECLGYAAEFRDSETGMHTIRVGHYTQCLAKAMGMNDREAESLLYSAPMHDVGKIGISDKILLKPGRLEGDEWIIMMQHTLIGEKILSRSKNKLLQQAAIIALNHHEKWDGSGYPNGLAENDIHLYGRIVAIVDVFDALTMERPYKQAWSVDSAVELINSESGKHFDPSLVELFNKSLDEIFEIKQLYADKDKPSELLSEYLSH